MAEFPPDFSITHDGQNYRPLGIREHVKLDGAAVSLIDWQTECPSCGVTFVISTMLNFEKPRRRCEDCKAPGRTIKSERRRRARVMANE